MSHISSKRNYFYLFYNGKRSKLYRLPENPPQSCVAVRLPARAEKSRRALSLRQPLRLQIVEKGLTEFGSKSQIESNSFLARACTGPKILIVRQVCGFLEQKSVRVAGLQTRANACICAKGCQKYFFDSLKPQSAVSKTASAALCD